MTEFPLKEMLKVDADNKEENSALILSIAYLHDVLNDILMKLDEMQNDRVRTI